MGPGIFSIRKCSGRIAWSRPRSHHRGSSKRRRSAIPHGDVLRLETDQIDYLPGLSSKFPGGQARVGRASELLMGEGGGFGSRVTRLGLFQPDEIVVDLPDEIDKDRLFDVAVAADHRLVSEDDPKRVVGIVAGPLRQHRSGSVTPLPAAN